MPLSCTPQPIRFCGSCSFWRFTKSGFSSPGGTIAMTKLFVGGLPFDVTEDQLHEMFVALGQVASAKLITDRDTGRSKGFGFVEMPNDTEAQAAITKLNGTQVGGRSIAVNVARPMEPRGDR